MKHDTSVSALLAGIHKLKTQPLDIGASDSTYVHRWQATKQQGLAAARVLLAIRRCKAAAQMMNHAGQHHAATSVWQWQLSSAAQVVRQNSHESASTRMAT